MNSTRRTCLPEFSCKFFNVALAFVCLVAIAHPYVYVIILKKLMGVHGTEQVEVSRIQVTAAQTKARQWNDQYRRCEQLGRRNRKSKLANQIAH
ncbi:hypothetical protein T11_13158 [Trichinella zimbabwensis]|uniref:Uncharacterized protein n=1 Tax=Trichinella zimbabwensis TaxID=268475 RepID=A0A0V1HYJ1_9BILA|nr:hypothetical protein T11_13158 [Trichinella zimbabwensis]